jgi:hypothetical protein
MSTKVSVRSYVLAPWMRCGLAKCNNYLHSHKPNMATLHALEKSDAGDYKEMSSILAGLARSQPMSTAVHVCPNKL